jgi:quaternary ammonium compound-resistance protein SugE
LHKVVVSDSLTPADAGAAEPTAVVRRADARVTVAKLKQAPGKNVLMSGSRALWNDPLAVGWWTSGTSWWVPPCSAGMPDFAGRVRRGSGCSGAAGAMGRTPCCCATRWATSPSERLAWGENGSRARAIPAPGRAVPYPASDKTAPAETSMSWLILVLSGVLEAVWATALGKSDGLSRPLPVTAFVVALVLSMAGLGYAMRELPVGTSYAVWVGVGASLTAAHAMATGTESASVAKVLLLLGIVGCVVGLKVLH